MGRGRGRTGGGMGGMGSAGAGGMNGAPYGRSPGGGSSSGGGAGGGGGGGGSGGGGGGGAGQWGEYAASGRSSSGVMGGMARNGQDKVEYQFLVPSTKTGIIIGKGRSLHQGLSFFPHNYSIHF